MQNTFCQCFNGIFNGKHVIETHREIHYGSESKNQDLKNNKFIKIQITSNSKI